MTSKTKKTLGLIALAAAAFYLLKKKAPSAPGVIAVEDLPPGTVVNARALGCSTGIVVDIPSGWQGSLTTPGGPTAINGQRKKFFI